MCTRARLVAIAVLANFVILCGAARETPAGERNGKGSAPNSAPPPQASLPAPGPDKGGLASLYPGDEGIERDPRVLFVDDFETGTIDQIGARRRRLAKLESTHPPWTAFAQK